MTPYRIGIHAPYTLDEATFMACGLADYAMRLGVSVTLLSSQAHDNRVHYRWDREVLSGRRHDFNEWASRCSHIVWFDVQKSKVAMAARQKCKNILVVMPNRLQTDDIGLLGAFDALVCPQQASYQVLKKRYKNSVVHIPWDASRPHTTSPMMFGGKRLFVPLESKTADMMGSLIFHAIRVLLDRDEKMSVTFSHSRSFNRPSVLSLASLAEAHKGRVLLLKKPSYSDLTEAYATHDWAFVPEVRANTGLVALEALASGRPVIAFDTPPFSEFIKDKEHGILIPCEAEMGMLGLTNKVEGNAYRMQKSLMRIVKDETLYSRLCGEPWSEVLDRRYAFQQGWRRLWDYDQGE